MSITALIFCGLLAVSQGRVIKTDDVSISRVVNGEDAALGERPFQVSIQRFLNHFCGGSILNEYWIVTAAHCVNGDSDESDIDIIAGTVDLQGPYNIHRAHRIIVHESFSPDGSPTNDIALIKVTNPFKFSDRVQPIALPESYINVKTNSSAVLSGWGRLLNWSKTNKLQKVTIYIADQNYCRNVFKEKGLNIYPTQVCAFDPSMRRGQCSGDSGGPLTVDGKLAGIVSWSIKDPDCASTKFPGVYTRVSEFVEWINKHIELV